MKNLAIVLFIPFFIWLTGCSLISFVSWHNYFVYKLEHWDSTFRFFFMIFSLAGIVIYIALKPLVIKNIQQHNDN
jgi:hypothetical protein